MKVRDVMTKHPACCLRSDSAEHVTRIMKERDVGSVPE